MVAGKQEEYFWELLIFLLYGMHRYQVQLL
jgi:hypothetical protein